MLIADSISPCAAADTAYAIVLSRLPGRASTPPNSGSMLLRKSEPLWAEVVAVNATTSAAAPATSAIKRKGARLVPVAT